MVLKFGVFCGFKVRLLVIVWSKDHLMAQTVLVRALISCKGLLYYKIQAAVFRFGHSLFTGMWLILGQYLKCLEITNAESLFNDKINATPSELHATLRFYANSPSNDFHLL